MSWIKNNWDKVISIFLVIVVSGVTGFFSAIISLRGEIGDLRTQVETLRVELEKAINPKFAIIDSNSGKISDLEKTIERLNSSTDFLRERTKTLSQQANSMLLIQVRKGNRISR